MLFWANLGGGYCKVLATATLTLDGRCGLGQPTGVCARASCVCVYVCVCVGAQLLEVTETRRGVEEGELGEETP